GYYQSARYPAAFFLRNIPVVRALSAKGDYAKALQLAARYVMQIKDPAIAKTLWLSACLCFIALAGIMAYLLIIKSAN
ncbi:MAG TPA: hypothetical protein VKB95_14995, partial [Chitinophagaceae bacterium]|nr:hypothetical protein [Chitinophagaceae bacterium]